MSTILVVEDDRTIGEIVRTALRGEGHNVAWVRTGQDARRVASHGVVDLVLLDLGLPDIDGLHLCGELKRAQPEAILVMLTARRSEMEVIVGLESGADDYLAKPFGVGELLARVQAHLRRASQPGGEETSYACGDLTVDGTTRRCFLGQREVILRSKEFDLLLRLTSAAGHAVSREVLMSDVWGADWFGSTKTLDVHVAAVRRRLAEAAAEPARTGQLPVITTLRGFGYRMEIAEPDPAPTRLSSATS